MKGFALGLALKQRRKATRKLPIFLVLPTSTPEHSFKSSTVKHLETVLHQFLKLDSENVVTKIREDFLSFSFPRRYNEAMSTCAGLYKKQIKPSSYEFAALLSVRAMPFVGSAMWNFSDEF